MRSRWSAIHLGTIVRYMSSGAGLIDGGRVFWIGTTMEEAETIDVALRRPWTSLSLPPELEAGFEMWNSGTRRRENQICIGVYLVGSLTFLILDARGGLLSMGLFLRLGLQCPATLWGIAVLNRARSPIVSACAVALPFVSMVGSVALISLVASTENRAIYLMAMGATNLSVSFVCRLRVRDGVALLLCTTALYAGLPLSGVFGTQPEQIIEIVVLFSLLTPLGLVPLARRERNEQDLYLLTLLGDLQSRELMRLVGELSRLSHRDALTDIGNRRSFDTALADLWTVAAGQGGQLALAMIDIDHFKSFNDVAGHAEGDRCLRAVAQAIAGRVRADCDVAARYGGEEFAVLMPLPALATSPVCDPVTLAENIRDAVERLSLAHPGLGQGRIVTVSVGVAVASPSHGAESSMSLIHAADRALYRSKRTGRNRVVRADPEPVVAVA